MALPAVASAASLIPWKEILKHAPEVWDAAKGLFNSKPADPPVDPAADLRIQLKNINERVEHLGAAQVEHARVLGMLAEQMRGMTAQIDALTARVERNMWIAIACGALACATLLIALVHT